MKLGKSEKPYKLLKKIQKIKNIHGLLAFILNYTNLYWSTERSHANFFIYSIII